VHLVGFIIRIYHNVRSSECQISYVSYFYGLGTLTYHLTSYILITLYRSKSLIIYYCRRLRCFRGAAREYYSVHVASYSPTSNILQLTVKFTVRIFYVETRRHGPFRGLKLTFISGLFSHSFVLHVGLCVLMEGLRIMTWTGEPWYV